MNDTAVNLKDVLTNDHYQEIIKVTYPDKLVLFVTLGTFRLDYEYEIEYENDFSVLVCRLHIITTQTHLNP